MGQGEPAIMHVGKIKGVKFGMFKHGYEHGGHSVHGRAFFRGKSAHNLYRGKRVNRYERGAVGYACHESQHHAEAMKKGNGYAELVLIGKFHAVAYCAPVIENIVMGKHYAFWKAGCARGVLHIYHLVAVQAVSDCLELFIGHLLRDIIKLFPGHHALRAVLSGENYGF